MRIEDLRFAIDGIDYLVTNYFFVFLCVLCVFAVVIYYHLVLEKSMTDAKIR